MEHEIKFTIHPSRVDEIEQWLESALIVDPAYPDSVVASVYFDSFSLNSFYEKLDGDYYKTKYRLRWYEVVRCPGGTASMAFAQVKRSIGSRRTKYSVPLNIASLELQYNAQDRLRLLEYRNSFESMPHLPRKTLWPILEVRYRRKRYLDTQSGLKVCVDKDISALSAGTIGFRCQKTRLETAVVEVKGASDALPPSMRALVTMGCRRAPYSKYARCLRALLLTSE